MDTVMLILFVLFMFFIFGGYHRQKFEEREGEQKRQEEGKTDNSPEAPSSSDVQERSR